MLSAYRVLDLTDDRGHLAGFMWAQMGADVIAVEPPGGSSARRRGPFVGDVVDIEGSLTHWAYNRGKRSVVLDLDSDVGIDRLRQLVAGADVLFESFTPGYLDERGLGTDALAEINPALVHVSITPFGSYGDKAGWAATDICVQAAAGNMSLTGDRDRAPLRAGGTLPQAFHNAASEGAGAAMIALWERQTRSGLGQHIDVSAQQSMTQATQSMSLSTPLGATPPDRAGGGIVLEGLHIQLMWPCADGFVSVTFLFGPFVGPFSARLIEWIYEEGFCDEATRDKDWVMYAMQLLDGSEPVEEFERVKSVIGEFLATKTHAELLEATLSRRLLIVPVMTTKGALGLEQFASRDFWESVELDDGTPVRFPGVFARFTESSLITLDRPPRLGEHTESVLAEPPCVPTVAVSGYASSGGLPLAGVKILDLTWVAAGPAATHVLADYGADIIRVESEHHMDGIRAIQPFPDDVADPNLSAAFHNYNAGKRGLALDFSKDGAVDVLWGLVDWADVVLESFSPGAMDKLGLGYDAVRARRPDIIMCSSCLMGQTGPLSTLAGFGTMAAAIGGHFYPVGWPDRSPTGSYGAYTDYTTPRWLVAVVMGALEHRRTTGQGQYIDFSQSEAAMHLITPAILDYAVNGRVWERDGNRDLDMAPHGAYPTRGEDAWIAIACSDDAMWSALADEMGASELASLTVGERRRRHDELDERISEWTSIRDGTNVMARLQQLGVAAHVVQGPRDLAGDPQLLSRGHFVEVTHDTRGTFTVEASHFHMSRTPAVTTHSGPCFGEHTYEVLTDVLGYDPDRVAELAARELFE